MKKTQQLKSQYGEKLQQLDAAITARLSILPPPPPTIRGKVKIFFRRFTGK